MSPAHRLRFTNHNAFYAQLTEATWAEICAGTTRHASWSHGHVPYPWPPLCNNTVTPIDMSMRAIHVMQDAFEHDSDLPMSTEATTAAVWSACAWFEHAPDRLWAHVKAGLIYRRSAKTNCGKKYMHRGWRGFERERWDVWEARLGELEGACVDVESRARLQKALAAMRRVRLNSE